MKIVTGLIASTRWIMGILSSFMTTACFIRAGLPLEDAKDSAIAVFCICSATMVLNDRIDDERDAVQGKTFAKEHRLLFTIWTILWWIVAVERSIHLREIDTRWMFLSLLMCALGIGYSWLRNIPGIPMIAVALTSALAGCFRVIVGDFRDWLYPVIVFFIILAREPLKDLVDVMADSIKGIGKKTLPLLWGTDSTMTFARGCLVIAGILLLWISKTPSTAVVAIGISLSAYLLRPAKIKTSKMILDISMFCFLIKSNFFSTPTMCSMNLISGKTDERFEEVKVAPSGKKVWLFAYLSFVTVLFSLGSLRSLTEGVLIALFGITGLIGLNYMPVNKDYETNEKTQYIRVRRMIIGMVVGLFASSLVTVGIPLVFTALAIPTLVITKMIRSEHCLVLKDHAAILGIALACSLLLSLQYTLVSLSLAYLPIVIFYYWKAYRENIPVWKPAFLC